MTPRSRAGEFLIGPTGQVLRTRLKAAEIDPEPGLADQCGQAFQVRGPGHGQAAAAPDSTAREIDVCRWWVESERLLVRPRLILALGASAARSVLGRTVSVPEPAR